MNTSVAEGVSVPFMVSEGVEVITTVATNTEATSIPTEEFITIRGVQYSTSLTELDLSEKNLVNNDIKDLYKMTNLTKLDLSWNQISDISALRNLTNLKELDLSCNLIEDISPLNNLTNLEILFLIENQISDITPLKNLNNLWLLNLGIDDKIVVFLGVLRGTLSTHRIPPRLRP